jgi:hypothetical protein
MWNLSRFWQRRVVRRFSPDHPPFAANSIVDIRFTTILQQIDELCPL